MDLGAVGRAERAGCQSGGPSAVPLTVTAVDQGDASSTLMVGSVNLNGSSKIFVIADLGVVDQARA